MALLIEFVVALLGLVLLAVFAGAGLVLWALNWLITRLPQPASAQPVPLILCPECEGNGIWLILDNSELACKLCDGQRLVTVPAMLPPRPLVRNGVRR